jgi:ribosome-associated protein
MLATGTSIRQTQAIADSIAEQLKLSGLRASHIEGYAEGEWILLDYADFVVHIFTETTREFYGLERLWRSAKRIDIAEPVGHRT